MNKSPMIYTIAEAYFPKHYEANCQAKITFRIGLQKQTIKELSPQFEQALKVIKERESNPEGQIEPLKITMAQLKDTIRRRNIQIADLKIRVRYEEGIKNRFNVKLRKVENCLDSYSPTIMDLAVKIRNIINS